MRKKITALLIFLTATLIPVFASVQIGDLYYNLDATSQTAEVTYQIYESTSNYTGLKTAIIPDSILYNDSVYHVTSIGERAFFQCSSLTSVTISNSVTNIEGWAFYYCSALTSATIGNGVTRIGTRAFYQCDGLTSIDIPNSITSIGSEAFAGCSGLTSLTIPNSVTSIEDNAFDGCSGLTSLTIGNSVTSIGDGAFAGCSGLTSLTIGNSVTSIEDNAFAGCSGLTSLIIGNSVTSIGDGAFLSCSSLTSLTIPNSVTSIGDDAFSLCSNLTSITIPNSVTSIASGIFDGCIGLTSLVVENGNTVYDSRNNCNAIIETESNTLIAGCKNTIIPNNITSIGSRAFSRCYSLTSIDIPNSVTSIGNSAFYGCSGLTSVTIPDSVTSIGDYAFFSCTGLSSITIPHSVISIGDDAFNDCVLRSVTCLATTPPNCSSYVFGYGGTTSFAVLYVPARSLTAYQTSYYWKAFSNIQAIPCDEKTIEETDTICQGETFVWHSHSYTQAGTYFDTLQTVLGCDSICILHLTINPSYRFVDTVVVCEGMPYEWRGKEYLQSGEYADSLQTIHGCDSIFMLILTVNPVFNFSDTAIICEGNNYEWHGHILLEPGIYYDSLQTKKGCDSIYTLNLLVCPTYIFNEEAWMYENHTYEWHNHTLTQAGVYYDSLQAQSGCDSVYVLTLNTKCVVETDTTILVCYNELPYEHNGVQYWDKDSTFHDTLTAISGCDSLRHTHYIRTGKCSELMLLYFCNNETPVIGGDTIRESGKYRFQEYTSSGLDSVAHVVIEFLPTYEDTIWLTGCDSLRYEGHVFHATTKEPYPVYRETVKGCDSVIFVNAIIYPSYLIEEIVSIREDKLPYKWQGRNITEAGNYIAEYESVHGCDSIITLQLMVTALPIYSVNVLADHGYVNGTGTYPEGTHITLVAVPDEGFEFQMWSDGTTENPKEFTVMQDTTFRALFFMPEVEQDVTVDSIETNSVTIIWDTVPGAVLYELRIYKNGELVVTYEVDPENNIVGEHHIGPDRIVARKDSTGGSSETLQVSVGGLESGQDYTYSLDALDDDRSYVGAQSGSFSTEEEPIDALDTLFDKRRPAEPRKVLRDGQLFIELPDGRIYTPIGEEMK